MKRLLALLFLSTTLVCSATGADTSLRKLWASSQYTSQALPAAWQVASPPAMEKDLTRYQQFEWRKDGSSIQSFINRFGIPSRYLGSRREKESDFLIYDLPSGHAVALYVPKPPATQFSACVIIAADGTLVELFK